MAAAETSARFALPRAPRFVRDAAILIALAISVALAGESPWLKRDKQPIEPTKPQPKKELQIRVVKLEKPKPLPAPKPPPQPPPQQQAQQQPKPPPPQKAPPPAQKREQPKVAHERAPAPRAVERNEPKPVQAVIAADSNAVGGVPMRVLVPRDPGELAAHLRNSGGCLVVSRLSGDSAEVLSVLGVQGHRAVETQGPPCDGVPRLLRDASLNAALGDPLGRVQANLPASEQHGELVLQVLLAARLNSEAQQALRARFGAVPLEAMAQAAAAQGYELRCFAEPAGALRCE